ncbi:2-hydroxyacid dehydrogenase [Glaciecola sp. 1036]|uniref:2-hydroxyacid dehydrogenase n=1 Tax=Alteromonadaceae TaxID=72275 RepID=UPI003CFC3CF1
MFDARTYDSHAFNQYCPDNIEILPLEAALNANTAVLAKGCKVVCIFVNDKCDEQAIETLAKYGVELIALRCAGFNNVDLAACKQHNIDVVRVPAYSPHAVAEHTIALMMMLNRNLHKAYLRNRTGQFLLDGLVGFDMHGKTVGIIGTGKIGQCVIDILLGFGCQIKAFDPYPNKAFENNPKVDYVDLDDLFEHSQIISLHAPLTQENKHLINAKSIAKMQSGVMIINTSRGALIDTRALIEGLKSGQVSKAGLDVYEEESEIFFKDKSNLVIDDDVFARLMSFNNVVITSHQAFLTNEALANIAQTTFENIQEYLQGKTGNALSFIVA